MDSDPCSSLPLSYSFVYMNWTIRLTVPASKPSMYMMLVVASHAPVNIPSQTVETRLDLPESLHHRRLQAQEIVGIRSLCELRTPFPGMQTSSRCISCCS